MNAFRTLFDAPTRIRQVERFGVGKFSGAELDAKCGHIRKIMEKRVPIVGAPRFSVVIPMHKEEQYILATLKSLAEQTHPSVEFVLVSNGEPKGNPTQRIAEDSGFTVLHVRKGGVGLARQEGLYAVKGDIVVTTDADTLQHNRWIETIEHSSHRHADIGGYGLVYSLSESLAYQSCITIQNFFRTLKKSPLPFGMSEANMWFSREVALRVGGYEKNLTYGEGTSLTKKMSKFGSIGFVGDTRAGVYTSDRRQISERMWACTQYVVGLAPKIRYLAVR